MTAQTFISPYGTYHLERLPKQHNQSLQAWDAADEYLLNYLCENQLISTQTRLLIINDSFGALSVNLHMCYPYNWSDSLLSHQACAYNAKSNQIDELIHYIPSTESLAGEFDLVIIKIPKTLALLEDFLIRLKPHTHAKTKIIAAGMIKHLPKSAIPLFERIIGKTETSLAKKKARLVFSHVDTNIKHAVPPYPKHYLEPTTQLQLSNHANVFSKDKLDIGSRFLLEQFKLLPPKRHIVDLGCGNGVLGIMAQRQYADAMLSFLDESYMAVASAKANYQRTFPECTANFIISDCLSHLVDDVDLILCNPPFHQQHSLGDFIAWQMFSQSMKRLNPKGELWVVGNRHLNYHSKLKKLFGRCELIASNKKFVVLRAIKQ